MKRAFWVETTPWAGEARNEYRVYINAENCTQGHKDGLRFECDDNWSVVEQIAKVQLDEHIRMSPRNIVPCSQCTRLEGVCLVPAPEVTFD